MLMGVPFDSQLWAPYCSAALRSVSEQAARASVVRVSHVADRRRHILESMNWDALDCWHW